MLAEGLGMKSFNCRFSGGIWAAAIFLFPLFIGGTGLDAEAFSLGRIRVTGDYDKAFRAEIPVRVDGRAGLSVTLGGDEDYKRIGVKRPGFIDNLRVEVAGHPLLEGQKIIYVTSPDPIYRPSFNLVVKARLGGGMILENYFLALDFQKNLTLELPQSEEEREAMKKIAEELKSLKPGAEKRPAPEPPVETAAAEPEDQAAMIEKMRGEEREAVRREKAVAPAPEPAPEAEPESAAPAPEAQIIVEDIVIKAQEPEAVMAALAEPKQAPVEPAAAMEPIEQAEPAGRTEPVMPAVHGVLPVFSAEPARNVYHVLNGDTLYKIAKKLGASGADMDRVVVALWTHNKDSFIKGNLHGIRSGARLDFSRVNKTAEGITVSGARRIIAEQWPVWRGSAAVAKVAREEEAQEAESKPESGTEPQPEEIVAVAEKEPEPAAPEKQAEQAKESEKPGRPFVVHVASFVDREQARRLVALFRKKGYNAFEVLSFVPEKGNWYRVVMERFGSIEEAEEFSRSIKRLGLSRYTRILKLPYAIRIGEPMDADEAAALAGKYSGKGFSVYTLREGPGGGTSILMGAFNSRESAASAIDMVAGLGPEPAVVRP